MNTGFICQETIHQALRESSPPDRREVEDILAHARQLKGIGHSEAARLLLVEDDSLIDLIMATAHHVKNEIYGKRLVLFAPLYVSNYCNNECLYCAFRKSNTAVPRRTLNREDIRQETEILVSQGHKRILLVSGDGLGNATLDYLLDAIDTIYTVKVKHGEIRRININTAALPLEGFRRLKQAKIGTYQLFQETYHYDTYKKMHPKGPKADYLYHLTAMDRAISAGIDDVGVGLLFGLYDYRFEVMALLQHIRHLEETFGMGPHTISIPRLEPAAGSEVASNPPYPVNDRDFKKIIAILRITVPYTGMILSTRETVAMRQAALSLGISQISAGSRTNPGGYSQPDRCCRGDTFFTSGGQGGAFRENYPPTPGPTAKASADSLHPDDKFQGGSDCHENGEQFSLGDHRSLETVIKDIARLGYIPSFCTGCYRLGRTGQDFMDLAKPGLIKHFCLPNALTSFKEYLVHYACPQTRTLGENLIEDMIEEIPDTAVKEKTARHLGLIENGKTDLFL
jgi:2-iminoacetate synthase